MQFETQLHKPKKEGSREKNGRHSRTQTHIQTCYSFLRSHKSLPSFDSTAEIYSSLCSILARPTARHSPNQQTAAPATTKALLTHTYTEPHRHNKSPANTHINGTASNGPAAFSHIPTDSGKQTQSWQRFHLNIFGTM